MSNFVRYIVVIYIKYDVSSKTKMLVSTKSSSYYHFKALLKNFTNSYKSKSEKQIIQIIMYRELSY